MAWVEFKYSASRKIINKETLINWMGKMAMKEEMVKNLKKRLNDIN